MATFLYFPINSQNKIHKRIVDLYQKQILIDFYKLKMKDKKTT
jgi:hypothetical protein